MKREFRANRKLTPQLYIHSLKQAMDGFTSYHCPKPDGKVNPRVNEPGDLPP